LQSLTFLAKAGRVDVNRVLVLRTASDFDSPTAEVAATESLARNVRGSFTAFLPSVETAWRVGHAVVNELVAKWPQYRTAIPGSTPH